MLQKIKALFREFFSFIDASRQSPLAFKWTWVSLLGVVFASWLLFLWRDVWFLEVFFDNVFVYFPIYLVHEFSHRIAWGLTHSQTISLWAGPMTEALLPAVLLWLCWRIPGGRWPSVLVWYYWAGCWYSTARYCADARAMNLHLTSSDMVSSSGPGTPGDWYYMLKPLGLLEWDTALAGLFYFAAAVCLVLAFYCLWYYWEHLNDFMRQDLKPDPWRQAAVPPASTARITAQDYERDPFTGRSSGNPWDRLSGKK